MERNYRKEQIMTIFHEGWKNSEYSCLKCDWSGSGDSCNSGRLYRKMYLELSCPACGEFIDVIIFPDADLHEKDETALTDEQKRELQEYREQMRVYLEQCLQSIDQLPEIDDNEFVLSWDQVEGETHILKGESQIWSEPLAYEGFDRFERIALLLRERYGSRIKDLVPTDRSRLFLHGDYSPSIDYVEKVRREIFGIGG